MFRFKRTLPIFSLFSFQFSKNRDCSSIRTHHGKCYTERCKSYTIMLKFLLYTMKVYENQSWHDLL